MVGRSFLDISQRRGIDNIADNEALDGLVLGDGLTGRHTANTLDVPTSLLVTSVIAPLDSHAGEEKQRKIREKMDNYIPRHRTGRPPPIIHGQTIQP